jgi:hypothetical protein
MEFKWSVEKVVVAEGNLVTHVHWRCEAEGFACSGVRGLARSDSFTAYDQLTEQQVLGWCFAPETITWADPIDNTITTITKLLKDDGEAQIASQINRVKNEPALPWV